MNVNEYQQISMNINKQSPSWVAKLLQQNEQNDDSSCGYCAWDPPKQVESDPRAWTMRNCGQIRADLKQMSFKFWLNVGKPGCHKPILYIYINLPWLGMVNSLNIPPIKLLMTGGWFMSLWQWVGPHIRQWNRWVSSFVLPKCHLNCHKKRGDIIWYTLIYPIHI
jgi:hypothetical protein